MPLRPDIFTKNRQFFFYCIIGGAGVTLDFLVYSALVWKLNVAYRHANAVGYASGTVLSFILNAHYNFKATDRLLLRFISFCAVALLGYTASAVTLWLLVERVMMDKYLSKLATIVIVVLVQYNLNRVLSFRKSQPAANA